MGGGRFLQAGAASPLEKALSIPSCGSTRVVEEPCWAYPYEGSDVNPLTKILEGHGVPGQPQRTTTKIYGRYDGQGDGKTPEEGEGSGGGD